MPSIGSDFADADIQDPETYAPILAAIQERSLAMSNFGGSTAPAFTPVAVGTDVQAVTFWAGLQAKVAQLYASLSGSYFLRPSFTPAGRPPFRMSDAFDTFGFNQPVFDPANPAEEDGISEARYIGIAQAFEAEGIPGWTRKRPREITAANAAFDDQGNAAADGQRAYFLNGTVPPPAADQVVPFPRPPIYAFDGGAWVPADPADGGVDTLVGEAGNERTIASTGAATDVDGRPAVPGQLARGPGGRVYQRNVFGTWTDLGDATDQLPDRLPTGNGVIAGTILPGDYIGPWLLADLARMIRAVGNRTRHSPSRVNAHVGSGSTFPTSSGYVATVAEAESLALADYEVTESTGTATTFPGAFAGLRRRDQWPSGSVGYAMNLERTSVEFFASTASHRPRQVEIGGSAFPPGWTDFGTQPDDPNHPFDAQGDDVDDRTLAIIGTFSVAQGTRDSETIRFPDSTSTPPPSRPTSLGPSDVPPGPTRPEALNNTSKGWGWNAGYVVATWSFEYT